MDGWRWGLWRGNRYRLGLSVTGDTFTANWEFDFTNSPGQLQTLLLDGRGALTIFDRTRLDSDPGGEFGTPGSARGRDWTSALGDNTTIDVTFLDPTTVGQRRPRSAICSSKCSLSSEIRAPGSTLRSSRTRTTIRGCRFPNRRRYCSLDSGCWRSPACIADASKRRDLSFLKAPHGALFLFAQAPNASPQTLNGEQRYSLGNAWEVWLLDQGSNLGPAD